MLTVTGTYIVLPVEGSSELLLDSVVPAAGTKNISAEISGITKKQLDKNPNQPAFTD